MVSVPADTSGDKHSSKWIYCGVPIPLPNQSNSTCEVRPLIDLSTGDFKFSDFDA